VAGTRGPKDMIEACRFRLGDPASAWRKTIIPPSHRVVIGALRLDDPAVFAQLLQMTVERSRTEPNVAARRFRDFLIDVVAVALSVTERNEYLEHDRP
jgi:hypothetical protein